MQTENQSTASTPLSGIFRRVAFPFMLFSLVLAGLLLLSWLLLLPALTSIEVAGSVRDIEELKLYRNDLRHSIEDLKSRRHDFLFPLAGTPYAELSLGKLRATKFHFLYEQIRVTGKQLVEGQPDSVALKQMRYVAPEKTVFLDGMIRNVGPQSMTIHAQFVEALRSLPGVTGVKSSRYTRNEDPVIGFYSPFTIELLLQ